MSSFKALLKAYRQEKAISQKTLGMQCTPPFSQNYIAQLEVGIKIPPPEESVLSIAKALSLSKEKTKKLLESAESERLYNSLRKNNGKLEVESFIRCLEDNLTQEEVINLGKRLLKSATATK